MKRTKIICTIGPASEKVSTLVTMVRLGMNVARLNFSHGTHASHARLVRNIRAAERKTGELVTILGDLQGPKIRLGDLPDAGVELASGSIVTFSTAASAYRDGLLPVTYKGLHRDVKKGDRILIDDGLIEVKVIEVKGKAIRAKVMNGGKVTSHKGMNFPDSTLRVSPITAKDRSDVVFGVEQGVDWIALSFVTDPKDVLTLRRLIAKAAGRNRVKPRIIVKIEKHEAIRRFDEILAVADGVMVARGDLGVEIPAEEVPVRQKEIIEKCRIAGKPVVVATQMLDSMTRNPRPTRAEVSDVGHAVFDHTDAVMLSGESATGKYPVEAVRIMGKILNEAEASPFDDVAETFRRSVTMEASIAHTLKILSLANHLDGVLASIAFAPWSETLLMAHPEIPLYLATPTLTEARQANLRWGLRPFLLTGATRTSFVRRAVAVLKKKKWVKKAMWLAVVIGGEHGAGFDLVEVDE